jgi:hypothetical protein
MHEVITIDGLGDVAAHAAGDGLTAMERGARRLARVYAPVSPPALGGLWDTLTNLVGGNSVPNPAYQATAAITGQQTTTSTPDAPAGGATADGTTAAQSACANVPTWLQAVTGCSNANVTPAPGQSVATAPAAILTLLTGGGTDANGQPIPGLIPALPGLLGKLPAITWGLVALGTYFVFGAEIKAALAARRKIVG